MLINVGRQMLTKSDMAERASETLQESRKTSWKAIILNFSVFIKSNSTHTCKNRLSSE